MPTVVQGIISPYDSTTQVAENIVDAIDAIDRREVPFLNILGWALEPDGAGAARGVDSLVFPCTQALHTWQNDELIPNRSSVNAAYAVGGTTITLPANEADFFVVDDIIVATSGANTTHWRVTGVDLTNDILTVELIAGDAAHAVGTLIHSMGRPAVRGEQYATEGKRTSVTTDTNHTEIFGAGTEGVIAISGTELATRSYGIADELEYQTFKKLSELVIKMEQAALMGYRTGSLPTANDQPASRMGGLYYYVVGLSGGNISNANGLALASTEGTLKTLLDNIWDDGGAPTVLLMNSFNRRQMSDMLSPFVRTTRDEHVQGVVTNVYEYSFGMLNVALDKWVAPSQVWAITPTSIGLGPLKANGNDRSFTVEDLPKDGDYMRRAIVGEYTMEVRNRSRAHGLLRNLAEA